MADIIQGSAAPAAPVVPMTPDAVERQSVPVSALDLGFDVAAETDAEATRLRGTGSGLPEKGAPIGGPTGPVVTPPAPAATPTGPSGPAAVTPPAPAATPTGPSGPVEAPKPAKVKIGGKEYTVEELEKELTKRAQPAPAAAPVAAQPAPKEPTREEIASAENAWAQDFAKASEIKFGTTPDEFETILSGGKEAVDLFERKLTDVCAKSVMLARKTIYEDLNPQLAQFSKMLQPLTTQQIELERVATEQEFASSYPEFIPHGETAKQIAEALVKSYPAEVAKMTRPQFIAEVAGQTDRVLQAEYKRWNPNATGTWRDALKPAAAAAPAAVTPSPVVPAAAAPVVAAPAANSPAATPSGAAAPNWHKDTAASLRD